MSSSATRLTDMCSGHGPCEPRPNVSASSNVIINGRGSHRQGDAWAVHCSSFPHSSVLASGSSTVIVNGRQVGRVGDPVACGSVVASGSENVYIGG